MTVFNVEYLTVINSKEEFCKSISSFNSYLQSYDKIKVAGEKIKYDGVSFGYKVQHGDIVEGVQRFFHVKLECSSEDSLDKFKALLRGVRSLLTKASGKPPEVLWDDLSLLLAQQAYPIIHETENLMRKLITKFMFVKIGVAWTKDAVPKEVSESMRSKREDVRNNYLNEVDFIQLSHFLFKEYSTANSRVLNEKLGAATKLEDLTLSELQELVPRSNWERYFSPIVDCKIEYLQPRWEKLYELRCLVAHNNLLGDREFSEIVRIAGEVKEKLSQALEGLDKVKVTSEQKEDVAESVASERDAALGGFIANWNALVESLYVLWSICVPNSSRREQSLTHALGDLVVHGVIYPELAEDLENMRKIRNYLVHNSAGDLDTGRYLNRLHVLREVILGLIEKNR